jgi:hypothetical protein
METIVIDVLQEKAMTILRSLASRQLIRMPSNYDTQHQFHVNKKPSDFRGSISAETAEKFHLHIQQSRNEWNNDC